VELNSSYRMQNSTSTQSDKWFKTYTTLRHTLFNQNAEQYRYGITDFSADRSEIEAFAIMGCYAV